MVRALCAVLWLGACRGGDESGRPAATRDSGVHAGARDAGEAGSGEAGGGAKRDGGQDAPGADLCDGAGCTPGQRCERDGDQATCIDNACSDLKCGDDERCAAHARGGHVCVSAACDTAVDCPNDFYCDEHALCRADVCEPGARACDGSTVLACSDDGGGYTERFRCLAAEPFTSDCVDDGTGAASCTCEDDWDCPAFTVCEAGTCAGTGTQPSCSLPPVPFADTPPAVEIHWGGDSRDAPGAHDGTAAQNAAPWPNFSQVVDTPIVANLDDDNLDGLVNELDFPEILFVAHSSGDPWSDAVVRAIHGGGVNKGADYFARCGDKLWTRAAPSAEPCADGEPDADAGAPVAVGDLDYDGVPEIVYATEARTFRILDNTGAEILTLAQPWNLANDGDTLALANLDYTGLAEIIVGRNVYVFDRPAGGALQLTHILSGAAAMGSNDTVATMACPADIRPELPGQEIVAGGTLYRMPDALPACAAPPCSGSLEIVWNAPDVAGNAGLSGEGFCAVADVWGADRDQAPGPSNPPDGSAEVILIDNGDLTILDGATGAIISDRALGGTVGGAPNVDDFDGDGFMEIASALEDYYIVVDLQSSTGAGGSCPDWPAVIARQDQPGGAHNPNPARMPGGSCTDDGDCADASVCNRAIGQCVCLHNGWHRDSDDDSSRATSSSVFDFNGDGAAEVLYNDECEFRVYDGVSGEVLFAQVSRSRTAIENPVVADVDNDGNAEVVTGMNTAEEDRCDDDPGGIPQGPNGVRVWGDPTDTWVSARRIWNQQSYHVTNATEAGAIPRHAPDSWAALGGRTYNTYRSQPRNYGTAPDLRVIAVGVSSPQGGCGATGDTIEIAVEVRNAGDLRVGPGVPVRFVGVWGDEEEPLLGDGGEPLEATLQASLEPGHSVLLSATFDAGDGERGELPDRVRVIVDPTSDDLPNGMERECFEDNNALERDVDSGEAQPDLVLELGAAAVRCPDAEVEVTVRNEGAGPARDVAVRLYAGDPSQGGSRLHEQTLADPLAPGDEQTFTAVIAGVPTSREITIFGVIDPDAAIEECNEANNKDAADDPILCPGGPD